jgi:hypothetical protein
VSDHSPEAYAIGKALFQAEHLDAERDMIDTQWAIPAIRRPWLKRAQVALDAQAVYRLEQAV